MVFKKRGFWAMQTKAGREGKPKKEREVRGKKTEKARKQGGERKEGEDVGRGEGTPKPTWHMREGAAFPCPCPCLCSCSCHCRLAPPSLPSLFPPLRHRQRVAAGASRGSGRSRSKARARAKRPGMERGLDCQLWHACAGGMVQLPSVGCKVIYFPQGHGEQAATTPDFPRSLGPAGTIPCRVTSVQFLADTETDEVFARMRLQPEGSGGGEVEEGQQASPPPEKPASFAKTLTQSDANNGGGFSVPRYCAETIFPPLDYSVDPPVQTVLAKDVHGDTWKFRHIYRGTPRRHLLTTGWSTFVNQKKLVAGDAIVFLRSATGELCVGVRRSMRGTSGAGDSSSWHSAAVPASHRPRWEVKAPDNYADFLGDNGRSGTVPPAGGTSGSGGTPGQGHGAANSFARNRARVTAKSVLEAASLAVAGHPFEVVYYPRASTAEFCVKAHVVKAALDHTWYAGMRFKMAFETEDSSRISWFMGTISAVQAADPMLWPKSPWRVLQVTWDEPDLLQGVSRVSPWQVELVSTLPMQLPPFASLPSKKKARPLQSSSTNSDYPLQAQNAILAMPLASLANSVMGHIGPWHALVEDIPAGMQEARQGRFEGPAAAAATAFRAKKVQGGMPMDGVYHRPDHMGIVSHGSSVFAAAGSSPLHQEWSGSISAKTPTTFMGSSNGNGSQGMPSGKCSITTTTTTTTTKAAQFLLFGQPIDLTDMSRETGMAKPKQQESGGSSSDDQSVHNFTADSGGRGRGGSSSYASSGDQAENMPASYQDNSSKDAASLKWLREQGSMSAASKERVDKLVRDSFSHCKVFKDSEEVGRTVNLAGFSDYDELFGWLASMFCMDKMDLQNNLVYRNADGSTLRVGKEPYSYFMKSVRRLTILPDAAAARS